MPGITYLSFNPQTAVSSVVTPLVGGSTSGSGRYVSLDTDVSIHLAKLGLLPLLSDIVQFPVLATPWVGKEFFEKGEQFFPEVGGWSSEVREAWALEVTPVIVNDSGTDQFALGSGWYIEGMSKPDRGVVAIASYDVSNSLVLSNDSLVRRASAKNGIECHGHEWLLCKGVFLGVFSSEEAIAFHERLDQDPTARVRTTEKFQRELSKFTSDL
ncbi:MAG: hypothetical protein ABIJ46_01475 [bacterium]